jgi:hypothetical protein
MGEFEPRALSAAPPRRFRDAPPASGCALAERTVTPTATAILLASHVYATTPGSAKHCPLHLD